jgi:hypothetical protein
MSDGKTHHRKWRQGWIFALPLSLFVYALVDIFRPAWFCSWAGCFSGNTVYTLGVLLGYAMGRYIDPDLDQMGATVADGRLVNEIPILGVFLYGHWATYGAIFRKHHRSFWTHCPGVSTAIRIFYQFYPLFVVLWLKDWNYAFIFQIFWGVFFGLTLADFIHFREDKLSLFSW